MHVGDHACQLLCAACHSLLLQMFSPVTAAAGRWAESIQEPDPPLLSAHLIKASDAAQPSFPSHPTPSLYLHQNFMHKFHVAYPTSCNHLAPQASEEYRPHHDYFSFEGRDKNGGNRLATVLMYLTDVEKGGETLFPHVPKAPEQTLENGWSNCSLKVSCTINIACVRVVQAGGSFGLH